MSDSISQYYLNQTLTYTDDGRLLDGDGDSVMMEWEKPIMEISAEIISKKGGKILNIGFGLGIIDSEIEKHDIDEHWIIEAHPDVYKKMFDDGWHLKPNVKILLGDWRWYLPYLPKFDGIFIDTWDEEIHTFHQWIPNILNKDGVYSFFNNPREDKDNIHMIKSEWDVLIKHSNIEYQEIKLDKIDSMSRQYKTGGYYWNPRWKTYYCPVITLKENV